MPSQTEITMVLMELQRNAGLPMLREDAFRKVRNELFGRKWLRAEQKRRFEVDFGNAVRWLYSGNVRNAKYGEDS
jgi:hypothetical protein